MSAFTEGGIRIEFPDNLNVRKFDDRETHGQQNMQAVDFIVELPNHFLFIEVKEPESAETMKKMKGWSRQFRDSFLYEWAEGRANKPVVYIVLLGLDGLTAAELSARSDELRRRLPELGPFNRPWKHRLAAACIVMDLANWNRWLPVYPAARIGNNPRRPK